MKNVQTIKLGPVQAIMRKLAASALALATLGAVVPLSSCADGERCPEHLPPAIPAALEVPAGQKLTFHATGVGVQIYVWTTNPTNPALASWVFSAPHAILLREDHGVVGRHFAGPTWQANDGSAVVGAKLASVTVDSTAIPWLLLQAASTSGDGIFSNVTYVQRLNTAGGLAPTTPGNTPGQEVLVPYLAEYYFYQAQP